MQCTRYQTSTRSTHLTAWGGEITVLEFGIRYYTWYLVLISAYDAPYMRRTNHTGAATRLGTCVSADNDVLGTAIE